MELAFRSSGHGPAVVILHGLFASSDSWAGPARALAHRRRVICVDLPNHGHSPGRSAMDYREMAGAVLRLMSRETGSASVIGHCIGGKVAMAMALMQPAAVNRLCVIDASPTTFLDPWMHQLRTMRRSLQLNGAAAAIAASRAAENGSLLSQFILPRGAITNAYVDWRCDLESIAPCIPDLREFPDELLDRRSEQTLHALVGSESAFVRPANETSYAPMFPSVRVQTIEGASHWIQAVRQEALVGALCTLLESAPERAVA